MEKTMEKQRKTNEHNEEQEEEDWKTWKNPWKNKEKLMNIMSYLNIHWVRPETLEIFTVSKASGRQKCYANARARWRNT